jgi:hypothetical protein
MEPKNHKISAIRPARGKIACYVRFVTQADGEVSEMKTLIFAGALALAALGLLSFAAPTYAAELSGVSAGQDMASVDIARVKRVLQLTPDQERYWPPVEAALRGIARRQEGAEPAGLVRRISHRVVSIALDSAAVARVARVARPLIERLRDDQKQGALVLAQEMGLGPVLAALNGARLAFSRSA